MMKYLDYLNAFILNGGGEGGGYPEPTGTKQITANGTGIDVKDYALADVAVPSSPAPSQYTLYESTRKLEVYSHNDINWSIGFVGSVKIDQTTGSLIHKDDFVCIKSIYAKNSQSGAPVPYGYAWVWGKVSDVSNILNYCRISFYEVDGLAIEPTDALPQLPISTNGAKQVFGYGSVNVNVQNSYTQSDNGKVVSNQQLVAQSGTTISSNGTYDTTLNNEVVVNVPTGGATPIVPLPTGTTLIEGTKIAITKVKNLTHGSTVSNLPVPEGTAIAVNDVVCIHETYKTQEDATLGDIWIMGTVTAVTRPVEADALVNLSGISFVINPTSTLPTREITENGTQKIVGYGDVNVNVSGGSSPAPAEYELKESTRKLTISNIAQLQIGQVWSTQVDTATADTIAVNDTICLHAQYADTATSTQTYGDIYVWGTIEGKWGSGTTYRNVTITVVGISLQPTVLPSNEIYTNGLEYTFGYGSVNVNVDIPITAVRISFLSDPTDSSGEVEFTYYPPETPELYTSCYLIGEYGGRAYAVYGQLTSFDESTSTGVVSVDTVVSGGVTSKADVHVQIYEFTSDPNAGIGTTITFRTDDDTKADPTVEEAIQTSASCNGLFVQGAYNGSSETAGEYLVHFSPQGLPYYDESNHVYSGVCDVIYKISAV